MKGRTYRRRMSTIASDVAYLLELLASILVVVASAVMLINMIIDVLAGGGLFAMRIDKFNSLLGDMLVITVGLEFVKLLTSRHFYDLIEVLMLATARQMIVEHLSMWEMLAGIMAIAILFMIRKYLPTALDRRMEKTGPHFLPFGFRSVANKEETRDEKAWDGEGDLPPEGSEES